jgi:long-chain acyl-CoA synthetase
MMPSGLWTVEVTKPSETPDGETPVRRNALSSHALTETPHPRIRTVFDLLRFSAERWGDAPCFGTRKVIKVHLDGKSVEAHGTRMVWELAPYEYRTYREVVSEVSTLASGLRAMGLEPGDKVAIYAETSYIHLHPLLIFVLPGNWQRMVPPLLRP